MEKDYNIKSRVFQMNNLLQLTNQKIIHRANRAVNSNRVTDLMLENLLNAFPKNVDSYQIAAKVLLIDKIYSTQLFRYNKKDFLTRLVENIRTIKDFDLRVEKGDPTVVCEIYRGLNKKLFSFASKYCCLHNTLVYKHDDYSIYDSAVRRLLPKYAKKVGIKLTGVQLDRWYKANDYKAFNDSVTNVLNVAQINIKNRKRKFDLFLWSQRNKI